MTARKNSTPEDQFHFQFHSTRLVWNRKCAYNTFYCYIETESSNVRTADFVEVGTQRSRLHTFFYLRTSV